jgi:hypothetical protein
MKRCVTQSRSIFTAVSVASVMLALASAAPAQTMTDPNPRPKSPPRAHGAESRPATSATRIKTCAAYGAGFAEIPGTGTCIKIGGFVEGTVSGGR